MAGVADDESQAVRPGKVDTGLDVVMGLGDDRINGIVAKCACFLRISGRAASIVGEVGPQSSRGLVGPI